VAVVSLLKRLFRDTRAATAVEYGLIVSMIVLAMIGALQGVAGETISMWDGVEADVSAASGP
jgi:pilus assembly protein Flp/PilA